jgi:hypothetical protein
LHQSLKQYDTPLEAYLQMKLAVAWQRKYTLKKI